MKNTFMILFASFLLIFTSCSREDVIRPGTLERLANLQLSSANTDVWGYIDAVTGREYALIGFRTNPQQQGVYIIDIGDPFAPRIVKTMRNIAGFDIKIWQNYMYTVTGGAGIGSITDISDPENPQIVGSFTSGHNLFISESGYMFVETQFAPLRVYNLNANPENPVLVWSGNADGHDTAVIGNRWYDFGAYISTNVFDITNPADPQLLTSISAPFISFHHSGWPTEDGKILYICNELAIHPQPDITIWNIEDFSNPEFIGEYKDQNAKVHNFYVIGNVAFVSYYSDGIKIFDISKPAALTLIDEFDTSASDEEKFVGAFGIYPFLPSGLILVSDIATGLHIFRLNLDETNSLTSTAP